MKNFELYNLDTAPKMSVGHLKMVKEDVGFIPNVFAITSQSPKALKGLLELNGTFSSSSFTAEEQQIILLATSTENECIYCVAGHTAFGKSMGMDENIISDMRNKKTTSNHRFNTLNSTVRELIQTRGRISTSQMEQFFIDGYSKEQFLELILGICVKTFTNYASNAIKIPLDEVFKEFSWERPSVSPAM